MSKFLRIALAWLLAAALPIQGSAAQAMQLCGPAHHEQAQAAVMGAHDHGRDHGDSGAHAGHHEANGPQDHEGGKTQPGPAGKCSACASCCGAAAIATAVLVVEVIPPQTPVVATIPAGHAREATGGLERPPRPSRA